ncbi:MAG: 23S rRNA (adenine(2503)-C(2))-methyltransferase RlmN [Verrucomicrobiota bacterium]
MPSKLKLLQDSPPEAWDIGNYPKYRRKQIAEWLFKRKVHTFDAMHTLPKDLKAHLRERYVFSPLSLVRHQGSKDTTQKFLFSTQDNDFIECVLIPASPALYGERSDRFTLCISSQVGCAYGCKFCASGLEGWKRNLSPGEIVSQIIAVEQITKMPVRNLVFMGMGEPFANYKNLIVALTIINASWGLNIGARHLTVSTSGLVPMIKKFADQPLQIRLAISLHGASDAVRNQIMPINRKYPIQELFAACHYFNHKKKQKITFEYILIEGINDAIDEAYSLAKHARKLHAKINLIPYNTVSGLTWNRPSEPSMKKFHSVLRDLGIQTTIRLEKGHDIDAACGQLRLKEIRS